MPETTNRRAVLGAVLAAGAVATTAVLPAAASEPQLSAVDRRVLDLWRRRAKLMAIYRKLNDDLPDHDKVSSAEWRRLCDRCDDATTAICAVEDQIADHMEASILALAAIIIAEARNLHEPVHERVFLASLVAIRPQLVLMLLDSPLVS